MTQITPASTPTNEASGRFYKPGSENGVTQSTQKSHANSTRKIACDLDSHYWQNKQFNKTPQQARKGIESMENGESPSVV